MVVVVVVVGGEGGVTGIGAPCPTFLYDPDFEVEIMNKNHSILNQN